jgi:hypothetical protein
MLNGRNKKEVRERGRNERRKDGKWKEEKRRKDVTILNGKKKKEERKEER